LVGRAVERPEESSWDLNEATNIIREVLLRLRRSVPPGVRLMFVHHGADSGLAIGQAFSGDRFCDLADACVGLDGAMVRDAEHFLPDRHWTAKGHGVVGNLLAQKMKQEAP
jgi:hypothetical protein